MIEVYGHGGDLRTASEAFGLPEGEFIDFSANMNPFGPPPGVVRWLAEGEAASLLAHYPDPACRPLRRQLAAKYGVDEACVWIGNGAAELIDLALRVLAPATTLIARPCFVEYEQAAVKAGSRLREYRMPAEEGFALTPGDAFLRAADESDAIVLGHPNNPTGRLPDPELLEAVRARLSPGQTLVLDEAFLDFHEDERRFSWLRRAASDPQVIVLRSMTKFYAVPGIRLGFVVAVPETIERIRALQTPWSVNAFAQRIGELAIGDEAYEACTRGWLREERPWLEERLKEAGLRVCGGGVTNYVLAEIPPRTGWTAAKLQAALGRRGILIRDASRFAGLGSGHIRLAVRLRSDNERLVSALKQTLNG